MDNLKLTIKEFVLLFGIEWALKQHYPELDFTDLEVIVEETETIISKYNVEQMKVIVADIGYATERFVCSTLVEGVKNYYYYDIDYIWGEGYELEPNEEGFIVMEKCFPTPIIDYKNAKELEYATKQVTNTTPAEFTPLDLQDKV